MVIGLGDESHVILGVETSCDETSAAVVQGGREVLSNVITSQIELHQRFGGVVPEIASRRHVELIIPVIDQAFKEAGLKPGGLSAVAVTCGPGLVGALLVGVSVAKALACAWERPFVGINHIEGHIYANFLIDNPPDLPLVCLTVSGGHTELVYMKDHGCYEVLGRTRDDAAGEAFDKVARVLGLGYPGGPLLDRLAHEGDPDAVRLPRIHLGDETYDFSFSGIKTAVVNYVNRARQRGETIINADVAAGFQRVVVDSLIENTIKAAQSKGVKSVAVSGGVAANSMLRKELKLKGEANGLRVVYPPPILCTDNAAMVACAAHYHLLRGEVSDLSLNVISDLRIEDSTRI